MAIRGGGIVEHLENFGGAKIATTVEDKTWKQIVLYAPLLHTRCGNVWWCLPFLAVNDEGFSWVGGIVCGLR